MRRLLRAIRCDISVGASTLILPCLLGLLLAISSSLSLAARLRGLAGAGVLGGGYSIGDALLISIAGAMPPDAASQRGMRAPDIPFDWLLLMLLLAYATAVYPARDRDGFGRMLIAASGRRAWWLSKCVWVCLATAGVLGFYYGAIAISALAFGAKPELSWSAGVFSAMVPNSVPNQGLPHDVLCMLGLCVIVAWALQLLQLLCSLVVSPVGAFGLSTVVAALSFFIRSPLLLGNYLMASRVSFVSADGLSANTGAFLSLCCCCVVLVVGDRCVRNMDVLSRRNS